MKATKEEIYDLCFAKWGFASQVAMLAEELCELSVATLHLNRLIKNEGLKKYKVIDKVAEEIADVEIMIDEFKHHLRNVNNTNFLETIKIYKESKMDRLIDLLGLKNISIVEVKKSVS